MAASRRRTPHHFPTCRFPLPHATRDHPQPCSSKTPSAASQQWLLTNYGTSKLASYFPPHSEEVIFGYSGDKHADHDTLESGKQLVGNALDTLTAACTREMMKGNNENILNLDLDLRKCKDTHAPWLIDGDFNVILKREERLYGATLHDGSMEDFAATLLICGLLNGGFEGNPYTWTNSKMFQRLDRVVNNHQWASCFPNTKIQHLNRDGSDHCPLLFSFSKSFEKSPSSFWFLHAWVQHHDF
ncbi:Uncharacterized protein TCM_028413 [Theobroma cacao]|uniref:DNAse I-like superfamily protein n=1 Tax=Theobroma cacao TaxID=3641 RepID=A0A061GHQ0_THECC|nr:Uncharacterized protein TCM_028413 [Theobroma cacao]